MAGMICLFCGRDIHPPVPPSLADPFRQFPDPWGKLWTFHESCYWATLDFGVRLMGRGK